jgi:hypothetical protein
MVKNYLLALFFNFFVGATAPTNLNVAPPMLTTRSVNSLHAWRGEIERNEPSEMEASLSWGHAMQPSVCPPLVT